MLSLSVKDGFKVWDIRSISSYIKSQSLLSIAISPSGDLVFLNSSGDLNKVNAETGRLIWTLNAKDYSFAHDTDFFESSNISSRISDASEFELINTVRQVYCFLSFSFSI